jgi:hypothetical protein
MATNSIAMVRQAFPSPNSIAMYEIPTVNTLAVATNIVIVNTTNDPQQFSLSIDDLEIFDDTPIAAKTTISIDMKQVVQETIKGSASSDLVKIHISGVEIS